MITRFFEFLRFSLSDGDVTPPSVSGMDWQGLFRFGKEQALLGVLFDGIKRLPNGTVPDFRLLTKWANASMRIEKRNRRINELAVGLCRMISADGWRCCVLKGQGNTINYPNPHSRMPGDIDIWMVTDRPELTQGEAYPYRKSIRRYVSETFGEDHSHYYHVAFDYEGITAEAHYMPGMMNCPWYDKRLQEFYKRNADRQFDNVIDLPDDAGGIAIPTVAFNLVYQLSHLYRHFFGVGIGFRQMVDYHQLIVHNRQAVADATAAVQKDLHHVGLYGFAGAVMWVLQVTLGLEREAMIVPPDERRGRVLLEELLNSGNFGRYDKKYGGLNQMSALRKYFVRVGRSISFIRLYPAEAVSEPIYRTWHFFWRLCRN